MKRKITYEKDRKLSMSGQTKIAEILRKEGATKIKFIKFDIPETEPDPNSSSGGKDGKKQNISNIPESL